MINNELDINKLKNKKIGLCHGVFDVLHFGHINYFISAKKKVDVLIVSVTDDKFVNKGPGRPLFGIKERIKVLQSIKCINYVLISSNYTAEKIIDFIKPTFYFKGPDYKKINSKNDINLQKELKILKKNKGKFVIIDEETYSSTQIIKSNTSLFNYLSYDQKKYLKVLNNLKPTLNIDSQIENLKKQKVLILGELIIDKYVEVQPIGKSGKENFLVNKRINDFAFLGGTGYVANLLSKFSNNIDLVTFIGDKNQNLNFIKKNLNKKINYEFFKKKNSSTFVKLRYVDNYKKIKLNGIYDINDDDLNKVETLSFIKFLEKKISSYDMILVLDYGHGIINEKIVKYLEGYKDKLYINVQVNSFNRHYQSVQKFKKFNTLVINESEMRNEFRSIKLSIDELAKKFFKITKCKKLIITMGKNGSISYSKNKNKINKVFCPAFNNNPIDSLGSGDTYLALLSINLSAKNNIYFSNLVAALGSAYCVEQFGNKEVFDVEKLKKYLSRII